MDTAAKKLSHYRVGLQAAIAFRAGDDDAEGVVADCIEALDAQGKHELAQALNEALGRARWARA